MFSTSFPSFSYLPPPILVVRKHFTEHSYFARSRPPVPLSLPLSSLPLPHFR